MTVLVLNQDYSPLSWVDVDRAVTLLVSVDESTRCPTCHAKPGKDCIDLETRQRLVVVHKERKLPQATMFKSDPTRQIRSQYMALEWPLIIAMTRYVYRPYSARLKDPCGFATSRDILDRDRRKCAYCGGKAATIDHVFPRSRGGADSWENLVAACSSCNNKKDDRTPEEWCTQSPKHSASACKHKLRWQPYRPDTAASLQKLIWEELELILNAAPDAPAPA